METKNPLRKQIYWKSPDGNDEFIIADMPNKGFQIGFVNGVPVHQGEHINEYIRVIFEKLAEKFEKEHKKKVTIVHIKPHVGLLLRCKLDKPSFDSQIKRKLVKPKPKINLPKKVQTDILKWDGLDEELKKKFALKTKSEINKKKQKARVKKLHDATMAGINGESWKCTLILTEGETGCTLALNGNKYLPGGCQYNGVYPLRGKFINVDRHTEEKVDANQELCDIMEILKAEKGVDYTKPENFNKLRYGKIMFMTDADDDGQHIQGLGIKFIFTYLRSIAPFQFTLALLTPIVIAKNKKTHQVLKFYYHKQFLNWQKTQTPEELKDWEIDYKKGLGSWTATKDQILQDLFVAPTIITYAVDPQTDDMLKLAFDKKMTDERKQWISSYDINSQPNYTNPRPITDFFQEEFRAFCKTTVTRAIPYLMDGMKNVHRKILYAMFLKFGGSEKKKHIKLIQFAGFVMEKAGYHLGDTALYDSIIGMGQNYLTGPNNLNLVDIDGNAGDRRLKGKDASPPRYLKVNLHPIAHYIYRKEDFPLMNILYDEGEPIEPEVMYPVIPMCIVNRTLGIATGWSTNIPPHNPFTVCDWIISWIIEKKSKRDIPLNELVIDIANKPELIPWWRGYQGEIRRIANKPHEKFLNLGSFRSQMHVTFVTELPVETSIEAYKLWLVKEEGVYDETPEKAILRTFDNNSVMPNVDFRIYGMHEPTYEKLHLVRTIAMSNMTLIDTKGIPTKYDYIHEILCAWCPERLDVYERRRKHKLGDLEKDLRLATLRWMFIDDVLNKRIILEKRQKSDYIPLMEAKGYPCNKKRDGDDFTLMPMKIVTTERLKKLEKEIGTLREQIAYYSTVWAEDLWISDLQELRVQIEKLYSKGFF